MSEQTRKDLIKRFDSLRSERTTIQTMWDAIERFVTPYRGRFFYDQRSEHSIDWYNSRDIYDSTAVMAHKNLAASIHGSITSPTLRWFDLRFRDEKLNKNKQATNWMQAVSDAIHFELQDSNFDLEVQKAYQDLVGFGTAIITLEEGPGKGWGGLNFTAVPLKEAFFECDHRDQVSRFYRFMQMTPAQIIAQFGPTKVPEDIVKADEAGNMDKRDVLFCIYPRNNRVMKWGEKVASGRRPWEYCYMLKDSGEKLGDEGGYYEMPAFVPRWSTTSSSQWGNSPAMDALGDVLTLNQLVKDDLRARAKIIDPPWLAEERSIITDLNLDPATVTVVRSVNGIVPMVSGGSMQASDMAIDRLQSSIRNYFMTDRIDFPDLQAQPMTATEAQIRYERMQRYLGASLAHLRNDMLNPIVERAFNMLVRDGMVETPPEAVVANGGEYDIVYLGSLTRAQQTDEVAAIERTMMSAAQMAEVFPEALDVIDSQAAVRQIGRKLNAPADIMRDEGEVKAMAAERKELQMAQMAQAEGEAAQAMGEGQEALNGAQGPA